MMGVWCRLHNEWTIVYVFTGARYQIADMVKKLNYVWLTAEITV